MGDIFDQLPASSPGPTAGGGDIFDRVSAAPPAETQRKPNASELLPHFQLVNQAVTQAARDFVAARPGPATPPLPAGILGEPTTSGEFQNPRTGHISRGAPLGTGPLGFLDAPITGGQRIGEGVEQMAEPGLREKAGGTSKVIRGGMEAATPLMVGAFAGAPVATAVTVGTGIGLQRGSEGLLKAAKVPKEYAELASDLIAVFGAGSAYLKMKSLSKLPLVREGNIIEAKLRQSLGRAKDASLPAAARAAARAQADALMEGLKNTEAGSPSTSGKMEAAGAVAARPEVPAGVIHTRGKKAPPPEQQYTITGQPVRSINDEVHPEGTTGAEVEPQGGGGAGRVAAQSAQPGGGGQKPAAAVEQGNSGEYFRGDWNVKLNADGKRQAEEAADRTAGQFDEIRSGTKSRHIETASEYAATNPQAEVQASQAFDPMHMGEHEGERVTPERIAAVNDHMRNRPDEPIPGIGKFSGSPGEKPAVWSGRLIGGVEDAIAKWEPGKKTLIVTSGRDTQAVRAWAAKGMPADRSLDADVLTGEWQTKPGKLMRLDPRTGKVEDVESAEQDGIYFARHGETDANANGAVPAEVRADKPEGGAAKRIPYLFHGTSSNYLEAIRRDGLQPRRFGEQGKGTAGQGKLYLSPFPEIADEEGWNKTHGDQASGAPGVGGEPILVVLDRRKIRGLSRDPEISVGKSDMGALFSREQIPPDAIVAIHRGAEIPEAVKGYTSAVEQLARRSGRGSAPIPAVEAPQLGHSELWRDYDSGERRGMRGLRYEDAKRALRNIYKDQFDNQYRRYLQSVNPAPSESPRQQPPAALGNEVRADGGGVAEKPQQGGAETPQVAEPRSPGWVGNIPTSEIKVDAARFQFKANVGQGGAGEELREITKWDPEKGGVVAVWRDPADGQTYVVNGHHRLELAQRTGAPEMTVRYLRAATAQEARTKGALINIAEGRGESTDAAKVFRDTGMTPAELKANGVSLKGKVAREGLALSNLAQPIFEDVINGSLTPARGAVIGEGVARHADQVALYDLIRQRERGGKRLTNDQVEELIRLTNRTSTKTKSSADAAQGGLFGVEEMTLSLLPEKAEISDYVRKQLSAEKKLFGTVSTQAAAERLGEGGNVIKAADNAEVAVRANQGSVLYDRLSTKAGPIDDILDRAAQRIANGENGNEAKQDAYRQIRDFLRAQIRELSGVPEGSAGRDEGLGGEGPRPAGAGEPHQPEVGQRSLVSPSDEAASRAAEESGKARLLHDQLSAQLKSGGPAKPADLKPAETRGMFEEPGPEQGSLLQPVAEDAPPAPKAPGPITQFLKEEKGTSLVGAILKADAKEALALKATRDAALEELEKAKATPGEQKFGARTIEYFTGERDMWSARVNQVIERLRKLVPDPVEQEALSLMRDFKNKPEQLAQFLDGTHPAFQELDKDSPLLRGTPGSEYATARKRIEQLRPAILKALNPTSRMLEADQVLSTVAEGTLKEGQRLGILESRWTPEEYNPHILHPKGEGDLPTQRAGDRLGRAIGGKMGRYFAFAEKREFPTLLDAVVNNYKPKTLNALDAFTIHGDKFATARATHLLTQQLGDIGLGKWGVQERAPEGWVPLAPHSTEFRNLVGYEDEMGLPAAAEQRLFVPQYIADALKPITDPDYMGRIPIFRALRMTQAYQKAVQLGLSFFHAYTENLMSLANSGVKGWVKALRADRDSPEFLWSERDMIAHGGTSAIQGRTYEAYRALQPGSIPTWSEIWRHAPVVKQMDALAGQITEFTFGNLQRRFKVTDYQLHVADWMAKHPGAGAAELRTAKASIAKEINAVYGGLNAETLGVNRATTEVVRALMLAPDWTFSNVFNVKYALEKGTPAGKMARMFWVRTMAGGLAATQAMSLMMSGKLSTNLTQVYYGKDSEGREIYQNVFFKGASGDAVNLVHNVVDYGAVQGLARSLAGKAAPIPRAGIQIATNRDYLGRTIVPQGMNPIAGTVRGAYETGKALLPVPFTVSNLYNMLLGPDAGKYSVPEFLTTTFAGNPPRHTAPDGMRMTKGGLREKREKPRRDIFEEITSGKR